MPSLLRNLVAISVLAFHAQALIHERASQLRTLEYDFVIVGAGAGGAVIANRLSENSRHSVLLLEAGVSNRGAWLTEVPFLSPNLERSQYDWGYSTTPQRSLNNRVIDYPRGKVLGGSTSTNYMMFTRGPSDDYDRIARVTGDQGWSYNNLRPYLRKNEQWTEPADHHDTTGEYDPQFHSRTGILSIALPNFPHAADPICRVASDQLSSEFPWALDMNSGNTLGLGYAQSTTRDGARESSATSYLADRFVRRPNLNVLVNAHVTKVVKTGETSEGPIFRAVRFTQDGGATSVTVRARREVIISAGSVGTPVILMHSGIGPAAQLRRFGITPIIDNPSVGQNLTEHPRAIMSWFVNSTETFDSVMRDPAAVSAAEAEWNATQTGFLSAGSVSQLGFFKIPNSEFAGFQNPASGPNGPHMELVPFNGFFGPSPATGNYFSFGVIVTQPTSRGSITLTSSNPLAAPYINPNLLGTALDRKLMIYALRASRRFVQAPAFNNYILNEVVPDIGDTDASILRFLRGNTIHVYHPVSTAKMTKKGEKFGVVDPDLRVKGTVGLRIVDASVLPFIPSVHPQAPVYIIAERAADIIKAAN